MTRRWTSTVIDGCARMLISAADNVAARSGVPNPVAATRAVLYYLSDQDLSGADLRELVGGNLYARGFNWDPGLCNNCDKPLTDDQVEAAGLCAACSHWVCACAYRNSVDDETCQGCHLTRHSQRAPMPPCGCGCDPTPGAWGEYDTLSSASRQHFCDCGRFLRTGEALTGA